MVDWLVPVLLTILVLAVARMLGIGMSSKGPRIAADRPDLEYGVFTASFDRVLRASEVKNNLSGPQFRTGYSRDLEVSDLTIRAEIAARAFERDAELGRPVDGLNDLAICILMDQSGSMVNAMPTIAGQLRAVSKLLDSSGIEHAIYGFTTTGWHGLPARNEWIRHDKPAYPGRLCSTLHVVYKEFGQAWSPEDMQAMLDPGVFFENVDGEAIQWASELLSVRSESKKVLVVISDGAPVDDSTLTENGSGFLERHLIQVIQKIEDGKDVRLGALGLGYSVDRYYPVSRQVTSPELLAENLVDLVTELSSRT